MFMGLYGGVKEGKSERRFAVNVLMFCGFYLGMLQCEFDLFFSTASCTTLCGNAHEVLIKSQIKQSNGTDFRDTRNRQKVVAERFG